MRPGSRNALPHKIGQGNFGHVFAISVTDLDGREHKIARKKLVITDKSNFCSGLREIDISSRLVHANIVSLYHVSKIDTKEVGPEGGRYDDYALDFEYIPQGDMYQLINSLKSDKYFNLDDIKFIFTQCLLGIWYMHRNGYIHRDIKPTNILIGTNNIVKICDFGFAKRYLNNDCLTQEIGSRYFRAPETLLGQHYDYKSDIWSLGCVLHYLMTGGRFFVEMMEFEDLPNHNVNSDFIDPLIELRYIVGAMPYSITEDMFRGSDLEIIGDLLRSEPILTEVDFFNQHRFALDKQNDVLYYEVLLFRNLLVVNPDIRKSIAQITASRFLTSNATCARLIETEKVLVKTLAVESREEIVENKVSSSLPTYSYRSMARYAKKLFVEHRDKVWYTDKILFTAIDVFSRVTAADLTLLGPAAAEKKVISFFGSCLYVAIKFHSSICDIKVPAYNNLPFVPTKLSINELAVAKRTEDVILKTLSFRIFNLTVLDLLVEREVPEMISIVSLFLYITSGLNIDERGRTLTPRASYQKWEDNGRYLKQAYAHDVWLSLKEQCWAK